MWKLKNNEGGRSIVPIYGKDDVEGKGGTNVKVISKSEVEYKKKYKGLLDQQQKEK